MNNVCGAVGASVWRTRRGGGARARATSRSARAAAHEPAAGT